MRRKAPLMFGRIVDDPKYKNLRHIKNGKLGQKVLRDIGRGMCPEAFSKYKAAMGNDFHKALVAIQSQDPRVGEVNLAQFSKFVHLYRLYWDQIPWQKFKCLAPSSPCAQCNQRSCRKTMPEVVLELLEREHAKHMNLEKQQSEECCCPHQG